MQATVSWAWRARGAQTWTGAQARPERLQRICIYTGVSSGTEAASRRRTQRPRLRASGKGAAALRWARTSGSYGFAQKLRSTGGTRRCERLLIRRLLEERSLRVSREVVAELHHERGELYGR